MKKPKMQDAAPDVVRPRIDVFCAADLQRWADRFGVPTEQIVSAVGIYGSAADAVERGLDCIRGLRANQP